MQRTSLMSAVGAALGSAADASGHFSAPRIGEGVVRQRARDAQRRHQINAQFGDNSVFESFGRRLYRAKHQPGETGRQLAARLRATDAHLADTPTKPKRVRAKKVAA